MTSATRKTAADAGTTARASVASFIRVAPFALSMTDRDLNVVEVSPRWSDESGVSREAALGRSLFDLSPGSEDRWKATWLGCLEGRSERADRVQVPLPNGRSPWFQVEINPWLEPDGSVGGLLIATHDITDMVEALDHSRRAEQRLNMAVQLADLHVWELDYPSRTLSKMGSEDTFFTEPMTYEILYKDIWAGIHPDWREASQAAWEDHLRTGEPYRVEYRVARPDDKEVWAFSTSELITDAAGKPLRVVGAMQNITQRKLTEAALTTAARESEDANRAKSEFLANMSHEIRTPMNGVIGMNALLMRTALTPDQMKYADAVRASADCLMGLINDILDISKLEAGKVELETIDFSMASVVEDVVELLSPKAAEKSLEVAAFLDEGARAAFQGDPNRLRQVLLNLLSNALKFTESGYVAVEVKSAPAGPGRGKLRFEVLDTGIGLSPEAKAKLFQKFQQADGSVTRRYGGTGLGLSISRQLVELMGGVIGVGDRPGGGSVFWFELELGSAKAPPRAARPSATSLRGARILVVDDIEINRSIFLRQLEPEGAILTEAADGPSALAALAGADARDEPFDIVLLDHMMPGMSGEMVTAKIRANGAMVQPRIVLASSIGSPLQSDRAARAEFNAVMTKPVRHQALLDCLSDLMGQPPRPAAPAAVAETPAVAAPPPTIVEPPPEAAPQIQYARGQVLLAEDNEINTLLARTILEEVGYSVDCVVNGAEAVAAAQVRVYDLIIMDVQMPVMDGLQATRAIRALLSPVASTPILAMTANAMRSDREICLEAGMDDFISKPIDAGAFLRVVSRFMVAELWDDEDGDEAAGPALADMPDLDEAKLDSFAKMMPPAKLRAVLDTYLVGASTRLRRLEELVVELDFAGMAREAHDLKGVSGNFGALRLQALAEQLERACQAGDDAEAPRLMGEIRRASTAAWDLVGRWMAAAPDGKAVA